MITLFFTAQNKMRKVKHYCTCFTKEMKKQDGCVFFQKENLEGAKVDKLMEGEKNKPC